MRSLILTASLLAVSATTTPAAADPPPWAHAHGRRGPERDWDDGYRGRRHYGGYHRDYGYRCHRSSGTTGLIVGGAAGALLGRSLDEGRDRTTGTILGGAAGALLGRAVGREPRCG